MKVVIVLSDAVLSAVRRLDVFVTTSVTSLCCCCCCTFTGSKPRSDLALGVASPLTFPEPKLVDPTLRNVDLEIDVDGHEVYRGDELIALTPLEFDLLTQLARKPWQVFTRDVLLREVWGYRHSADTRLVNVHVQRLRSKIEHDPENPRIVVTVRGVGYRAGGPS